MAWSSTSCTFTSTLVRWHCAAVLVVAGLLGCGSPPVTVPHDGPPLNDQAYGAVVATATRQELFALSPQMRAYAAQHLEREDSTGGFRRDPRRALVAALYERHGLQLQYDATVTRTAAQAFERRAGHCLSLVLMTAAFAKHLGLPVSYQVVEVDETLDRRGDLQFYSGHINLVLQRHVPPLHQRLSSDTQDLVVDFLPGREVVGALTRTLDETTLVAMFMNNRAAELLSQGEVRSSYWWARAAVLQARDFLPALNTLGVIHARSEQPALAEAAYRQVLQLRPQHVPALGNLVALLRAQGRHHEAQAPAQLLAKLQPQPPFAQFEQGRQAMQAQDYARARQLFLQELQLQPHQSEVHHWAALAHLQLGDTAQARVHLKQARGYSRNLQDHGRYAAKLESLRTSVR